MFTEPNPDQIERAARIQKLQKNNPLIVGIKSAISTIIASTISGISSAVKITESLIQSNQNDSESLLDQNNRLKRKIFYYQFALSSIICSIFFYAYQDKIYHFIFDEQHIAQENEVLSTSAD